MKYLRQVSWVLIGLISSPLFAGCTHRDSRPTVERTSSQVAENENSSSAARDVITRYYTSQIKGDYNAAYECLGRRTQKRISQRDFVVRAHANNISYVQFKSVSNIHVEQQVGDKMRVGLILHTVIL